MRNTQEGIYWQSGDVGLERRGNIGSTRDQRGSHLKWFELVSLRIEGKGPARDFYASTTGNDVDKNHVAQFSIARTPRQICPSRLDT